MAHTERLVVISFLIVVIGLLGDMQRSGVDALSCPKCTPEYRARCSDVLQYDCPYGLTTDVCNCCPRCAKGEGEECGGLWNMKGFCGEGLECKHPTSSEHISNRPPGKCVTSGHDTADNEY